MLSVELRLFHDRSSTPTPFAKNQSNDSIFIPSNVFAWLLAMPIRQFYEVKRKKSKIYLYTKITLNKMNKHRLTFTKAKKATERF